MRRWILPLTLLVLVLTLSVGLIALAVHLDAYSKACRSPGIRPTYCWGTPTGSPSP